MINNGDVSLIVVRMNKQRYDIVGDIHGQYGKLTSLLYKLGYRPKDSTWRHLESRVVIFLGDYIDRGPRIREVLHSVRGMCEAGDAIAIMGNHEYNAVCYATPDGMGGYLKEHSERNTRTHSATLNQFEGKEEEWHEWIEWMKRLPLALDLGALRCVHACWDKQAVSMLKGKSLADDNLLRGCAEEGTANISPSATCSKARKCLLPPATCSETRKAPIAIQSEFAGGNCVTA